MKKKMFVHYDHEGDFLEVRFGKATPSYYKNLGEGIFERRDRKTKEVIGYAIFNVKKKKDKKSQDSKNKSKWTREVWWNLAMILVILSGAWMVASAIMSNQVIASLNSNNLSFETGFGIVTLSAENSIISQFILFVTGIVSAFLGLIFWFVGVFK